MLIRRRLPVLCVVATLSASCATTSHRVAGLGGFECSTETLTWVQLTPCKATIMETRGDQSDLPGGSHVFVDYGVEVPVRQTELSHKAVCAKLQLGAEAVGRNTRDFAEMFAQANCT